MKYAAIITYTTGERTGATVSANGLEAAWEEGDTSDVGEVPGPVPPGGSA